MGGRGNDRDLEGLVDLLRGVHRAMRERMVELAHDRGLPGLSPRLLVMREIAHEPDITVSEVARRTGVAKSQVSTTAAQLADDGLIRRGSDPDDARLLRLSLTDEGEATVRRWRAAYRAMLTSRLREVPEDDVQRVQQGLRILLTALED